MEINNNLIMIGLELETKEEVLTFMGNKLLAEGYVTEDFTESVLKREEKFPTGLPTVPYGVAIPHTDADKVIEPQIVFATLKEPVSFSVMGNAEAKVDVKIILMLALNHPDAQLGLLQKITEICQREDMVAKFGDIQSIEEFYELYALVK